jgi:hypothetical protein
MSQPDFDPFDPIAGAMRAMHQGNMITAKDARIKQLERQVAALREAGDGLWYVIRHEGRVDAADRTEAIEDWQEARNNV